MISENYLSLNKQSKLREHLEIGGGVPSQNISERRFINEETLTRLFKDMLKELEPSCSHGGVLKSFATAGFIMTEITYSAKSRLSEHSPANANFCFVLAFSHLTTRMNRSDGKAH
ncbi:MAG: hypothetical protein M3388_10195 [Acidobacteriota bacterium]|nr:hypothetical protein [Acidobacteriota bacterium]